MPARFPKRDGERIDEPLRDNINIDMNELAVLFQNTYGTIQKRMAALQRRE
jgi:hypothetical protein